MAWRVAHDHQRDRTMVLIGAILIASSWILYGVPYLLAKTWPTVSSVLRPLGWSFAVALVLTAILRGWPRLRLIAAVVAGLAGLALLPTVWGLVVLLGLTRGRALAWYLEDLGVRVVIPLGICIWLIAVAVTLRPRPQAPPLRI